MPHAGLGYGGWRLLLSALCFWCLTSLEKSSLIVIKLNGRQGVNCLGDLPPHGPMARVVSSPGRQSWCSLAAYPLADMYVMFDVFTGQWMCQWMLLFEIGTLVYKYLHLWDFLPLLTVPPASDEGFADNPSHCEHRPTCPPRLSGCRPWCSSLPSAGGAPRAAKQSYFTLE